MKRPLSLDMDALRSFVTGIEAGSFALAAERLCRSTSAVSAQMKKLEQQCGAALLVKDGRHLRLTEQGEVLMGYARRLLLVNDEALEALGGRHLAGNVRFGMQEDFGETLLPSVLGQFSRAHPDVQISARIARNQALCHDIDSDQLDLALSWLDEQRMPGIDALTTLPLQWIHHPDMPLQRYLDQCQPLPLVLFEPPCLMRDMALAALEAAGIPWRVAFVSRSLSGIWAAVSAGLGMTVRSTMGMPSSLTTAMAGALPVLPELGVALLQSQPRLPEATARLKTLLVDTLQQQVRS